MHERSHTKFQPDFVILELGGNDGLRGQPLKLMKQNLAAMIALCTEANALPVLFGMRIPPNYGRRYTEAFVGIYSTLAAEFNLAGFLPHLLSGIATDPNLLQRDGIHPTVAAQPLMSRTSSLKRRPSQLSQGTKRSDTNCISMRSKPRPEQVGQRPRMASKSLRIDD